MAKYLILESRDPFESNDVRYMYDLASGLARKGETVTLLLVQNGVLPARRCAESSQLAAIAEAGVEVLADDFSLRERGIRPDALTEGVRPASLDVAIDMLADGRKAIFH